MSIIAVNPHVVLSVVFFTMTCHILWYMCAFCQ